MGADNLAGGRDERRAIGGRVGSGGASPAAGGALLTSMLIAISIRGATEEHGNRLHFEVM